MSAIRSEFDKEPTFQEKITELTKTPKNRIAVALSNVHRNGEYFNVGPTALHSHIKALQNLLHDDTLDDMVVSAEFKVSSATKAAMRDDDVLQTFQSCQALLSFQFIRYTN